MANEEEDGRDYLGRTPYYQSYSVAFNSEALGLEVQKMHDIPVVRRLVNQNSRFAGAAEKGGVSIGSLLVGVANYPTLLAGNTYEEALARVKGSSRPMELTFWRLHATRDPPPYQGRLWQGFLRTFVGHWTGRFFMLRANGDLQAYAGTDASVPVESFSMLGAEVLSGAAARDAAVAHGLATGGGSSGTGGEGLFGEVDDTLFGLSLSSDSTRDPPYLFFRANDVERRAEWIGAFATLEFAHTAYDGSSNPLLLWPSFESVVRQGFADKASHQKAVDSSSGGVMSGLLTSSSSSSAARKWKRVWLLLLPPTPSADASTDSSGSAGKLLYFARAPSDVHEVPMGSLMLWGVRIEGQTADDNSKVAGKAATTAAPGVAASLTNGELENSDLALSSSSTSFVLHAATRALVLKFETPTECSEWASAIAGASQGPGGSKVVAPFNHSHHTDSTEELVERDRELHPTSLSSEREYLQRLEALRAHPEDTNVVDLQYSLMEGGAQRLLPSLQSSSSSSSQGSSDSSSHFPPSTGVLRKDFTAVAGQFYLPVADAYAADTVFDALVVRAASPSGAATSASDTATSAGSMRSATAKLGELLGGGDRRSLSSGSNSSEDRITQLASAAPLAAGVSLPLDIYRKYCIALYDKVGVENEAWEVLRCKLGLQRCEVLVRCDDKVTIQTKPTDSKALKLASSESTTPASPSQHSSTRAPPPPPSSSSSSSAPATNNTPPASRFSWTDVGTVYLTDRHLVFCRRGRLTTIRGFETTATARPLVRIVPLNTILEARELPDGSLLLDQASLLIARLDEQTVTWGPRGLVLGFSSTSSGALFSQSSSVDATDAAELRAIGGGKTRGARQRQLLKEAIVELIAAHQIAQAHAQKKNTASTKTPIGVTAGSGVGSSTLWPLSRAPETSRRRGARAMAVTFQTALALGPRQVWKRGGSVDLPEDQLWTIDMESRALPLWAALNLKRKRALMQATGRPASGLLFCTRELAEMQSPSPSSSSSQGGESKLRALSPVQRFLRDMVPPCKEAAAATASRDHAITMTWPLWQSCVTEWLTHRASRLCREQAAEDAQALLKGMPSFEERSVVVSKEQHAKLTAAYTQSFEPKTFRDEWQLFISFADPIVNNLIDVLPGTATHNLLHWKDPWTSFTVLALLLAIAWHDCVHLVPSFVLVAYSLFVVKTGSDLKPSSSERALVAPPAAVPTATTPAVASSQRTVEAPSQEEVTRRTSKTEPSPPSTPEASPVKSQQLSSGSVAHRHSSLEAADFGWQADEMDDDQMLAMASAAAMHAQRLSHGPPRENSGNNSITAGGGTWSMAQAADAVLGSVRAQKVSSQLESHMEGDDDDEKEDLSVEALTTQREHEGDVALDEVTTPTESSSAPLQPSTSKDVPSSPLPNLAQPESNASGPTAAAIPEESILKFMREMRAHLGRIQLILHRYNTYFLRLHALQTWKDRASTYILLAGLSLSAIWLAFVPARYTFSLASLYAFARPLRFSKKNRGRRALGDAFLHQWLDGIPLEHSTHRRIAVAVQISLENPPAAISSIDL